MVAKAVQRAPAPEDIGLPASNMGMLETPPAAVAVGMGGKGWQETVEGELVWDPKPINCYIERK